MKYFLAPASAAILPVLTVEEQAMLTDDSPYGDHVLEDLVAQHIVWAESQADAYAGARYPGLSILTAPPAYQKAILTIAKKSLLARRGYSTDTLDREYADARTWLRDIYEDRADLSPDPNGPGATDADADDVIFGTSTPPPVFGGGFAV